jgi:hypothetical protein
MNSADPLDAIACDCIPPVRPCRRQAIFVRSSTALLALCLVLAQTVQATSKLTGAMQSARAAHSATLLPNGKVLVAGGVGLDLNATATAELYDPATGAWAPTDGMNRSRFFHTATLLANGQVLVAGGSDFEGALATAELFDPATGKWTPTGAMAGPRQSHTTTLLTNGLVLVAGGLTTAMLDPDAVSLDSAELYDPESGNWRATGSLVAGRVLHSATLLPNGRALVVGGQNRGIQSVTELYDPVSGIWATNEPLSRVSHTGNLLPDGRVLVAGGGEEAFRPTRTANLYDAASGGWLTSAVPAEARFLHTATSLPAGKVLITGGAGESTNAIKKSVELFDSATGRWITLGDLVRTRLRHTATFLPTGEVLIVGGFGDHLESSAELYRLSATVTTITLGQPAKLPTDAIQISFTNVAGAGFTVLAATNASLPLSNWTELGGIAEISPGRYQFTDAGATNNPHRFYRVRSP